MDKTKNLTDGNIMSTLVRFAVPVLLAMFLQSLYSGVDLLIVGQFAETADVSGVATGSMLMHTVTAVVIGLAMGVTILVGQKLGARENDKVVKAIGASICLFSVIAVVLTAVLCLFTDFFCQLLHAPEEAYKETY
ncbi:MAG: MATE family efflux transporter, partial [Firmicutes bacterium]|nr:MATE family efflux transporter [Bacillota bacterium]